MKKECKHAFYSLSADRESDIVLVKEVTHHDDGRLERGVRIIKDFERPFWITKEQHRNHKEKKEWEHKSRLTKFKCPQWELQTAVGRAMGRRYRDVRQMMDSSYLYGAGLSTPTIIKQMYRSKYPDALSNNVVAVFDIESDVGATGDYVPIDQQTPVLFTLSCKDQVVTVATAEYASRVPNFVEATHQKFEELLGDVKAARNINLTVLVAPTPGQAIVKIFEYAHQWKPDIITAWNMVYDIKTCLRVLQNEGIDPADVFCDPIVPPQYRRFDFTIGKDKKVTDSGKVMPLLPHEQWHIVDCPASWVWLDAMCVYYRIRAAKQKEASYSLDAILNKVLKRGKLNFEAADGLAKAAWHRVMQYQYPIEYTIYNIFDCVGIELLDEVTLDLTQIVLTQIRSSEYAIYKSQPKRLVDDISFFAIAKGWIPGCFSDSVVTDEDALTVDKKGWIVALEPHLVIAKGMPMFKQFKGIHSNVFKYTADADIVSTYPTVQVILNISKQTTLFEVCRFKGIPEHVKREIGVNLTGGSTNAIEIAVAAFGAPTPDEMLDLYLMEKANMQQAA